MPYSAAADPLAAPTWITAIFTIALAVGAIITAVFAILAFSKQSAELRTLIEQVDDQRDTNKKLAGAAELQAQELRESLEERKRAGEQQHRAQAQQVYVTLEKTPGTSAAPDNSVVQGRMARPPAITATVHNYSQQIIREVQLQWHRGSASHGEPNPEPLGELIPGADAERERQFPADADLERCGAVVIFRDAAGIRWLRRPDGDLQEQQ
jgi:gas vesicle protein